MTNKWNDLGFKEQSQYICAISLICSGILIAFISFFLTNDIANGLLIYIAQAFVAGGSIFGVSIYFNGQLGQFESKATTTIIEQVKKVIDNEFENKKNS